MAASQLQAQSVLPKLLSLLNNPGSTTTYQTIQDAHQAACGDISYVQPSGTSYGTVGLDKSLTIVGRSHSEFGKESLLSNINVRTSNVTIKGVRFSSLSVNSSGSAPTPPPYSGLEIFECEFSNVSLGASASSNNITISDAVIRGNNITSTLYIYADTDDILVSNNILRSNLTIYNTSSAVFANNTFKNTGNLNYITTTFWYNHFV